MLRVLGLTLAFATGAWAQDNTLTVTDGDRTKVFSMADIQSMNQAVIETTTAWTDGVQTFEGPLMSDLLQEGGFLGENVAVEALDGYGIEIPRARLVEDGAILAIRMDGVPLPEDKAPYWIVFPYDQSPEMNDKDHQDWSVWALEKMTVQ